MCFDAAEVQCPEPPAAVNAHRSTVYRHYAAVVNYTCDDGYAMDASSSDDDADDVTSGADNRMRQIDGYTERSIVCQQDETWSSSSVDCQRKPQQRHL